MNQTDTVVNSATFQLRVCVANFSEKTDSLRVFVNKQELAKERTLRIGKETNPCPGTYFFTRSVNLSEGENLIRVVATNPTGVSESQRMVKNFKPETRLALVIGNADHNCLRPVEAETVHCQHSRGGGYGEKERPL